MAFSRIGIAALGGCNEFGFDVEKIEGGHMRIRAKPANDGAKAKTK